MPHLFVDNLTVIDCSVLDPERGLIGASWIVDIELIGELDKQSMVFDFGLVKKRIKQLIDAEVDHKLVIPKSHPQLSISENYTNNKYNTETLVHFTDLSRQTIEHISPADALCVIDSNIINHDAVIDYLSTLIKQILPSNVKDLILSFRQEEEDAFYYCYSHGLKKHDGNCQRIAHGHRSKIEIFENGKRNKTLEKHWSDTLADIYIGSRSDILSQTNYRTRFAYDAPQGHFEIELDNNTIHLIETDSTIECIAEHIANQVKASHPNSTIKIKAYEGVKKGAMAIR